MFRSSNPAFNDRILSQAQSLGAGETMTVQGMVNKTFVMLFLTIVTASWIWGKFFAQTPVFEGIEGATGGIPAYVGTAVTVGAFGGFIVALVTIFKKEWSMITAPIYALLEGLFLGGISAIFELSYPGIVIQAVMLTLATLFAMLMAYKSGMIKVTDKLRMGIFAATGAVCLIYIVSIVMGFFGASIPMIHSSGPVGIGFSLIVIGIAAFNFLIDFDLVERCASSGMPKYMEWYTAFGLMVTLIWLYLEFLRLLAKMNRR